MLCRADILMPRASRQKQHNVRSIRGNLSKVRHKVLLLGDRDTLLHPCQPAVPRLGSKMEVPSACVKLCPRVLRLHLQRVHEARQVERDDSPTIWTRCAYRSAYSLATIPAGQGSNRWLPLSPLAQIQQGSNLSVLRTFDHMPLLAKCKLEQ